MMQGKPLHLLQNVQEQEMSDRHVGLTSTQNIAKTGALGFTDACCGHRFNGLM